MSSNKIFKLAEDFEKKIFEEKYDVIADKLHDEVKSLYPYVADNNLKDKGDYFELILEITDTPHYSSDKPKLSSEELKNQIKNTIFIIKNKFDVIDLLIRNTSDTFTGDDAKVVAIIAKIVK